MFTRCLMGRSREMLVAPPSAAYTGQYDSFIGTLKIVNKLARSVVVYDRTDGNFQNNIFAFATRAVRAFAVPSAFGFMFGIVAKVNQSIVALASFQDDISTASAVAPGWTAARHKFLTAKCHTAISPVASLDPYSCFIDEHAYFIFQRRKNRVTLSVTPFTLLP